MRHDGLLYVIQKSDALSCGMRQVACQAVGHCDAVAAVVFECGFAALESSCGMTCLLAWERQGCHDQESGVEQAHQTGKGLHWA